MKAIAQVATYWRLLRGPAGPYLPGKLADLVRRPLRRRWARRWARRIRGRFTAASCHHLGLPLPPEQLLQHYRPELLNWASNQQARSLTTTGRDPRDVLEIARMHPWPLYAVAAHLTGERRWFESFEQEVLTFQQSHAAQRYPSLRGPLWSVAMDTAIRATNLLVAWDWFVQAGMRNDALDRCVATMAGEHACAIWGTLETAGGMATSHLLGDLVGLVVIEAYLGASVVPIDSALPWLEQETRRQILPDGMNFEASTGYHRQVVDLLRVARDVAQVCPTLQAQVSAPFNKAVNDALQAQAILQAYGMPLIGDNDDGLCIKLLRQPQILAEMTVVDARDADFPDFGLWIREIGDAGDAVLTLRHGPVGQDGKGGHAHNDLNAITLSVHGVPIVVDPGSAVYTADPDRRNRDRSTLAHATVAFPGIEQRWCSADALFWMIEEPGTRGAVHVGEASWEGTVRHAGKSRYEHHRSVTWQDRCITISDTVATLPAAIMVPFAPGVTVNAHGTSAECIQQGVSVMIQWEGAQLVNIDPLPTAPTYGSSVDGRILRLAMESHQVRWRITW